MHFLLECVLMKYVLLYVFVFQSTGIISVCHCALWFNIHLYATSDPLCLTDAVSGCAFPHWPVRSPPPDNTAQTLQCMPSLMFSMHLHEIFLGANTQDRNCLLHLDCSCPGSARLLSRAPATNYSLKGNMLMNADFCALHVSIQLFTPPMFVSLVNVN